MMAGFFGRRKGDPGREDSRASPGAPLGNAHETVASAAQGRAEPPRHDADLENAENLHGYDAGRNAEKSHQPFKDML